MGGGLRRVRFSAGHASCQQHERIPLARAGARLHIRSHASGGAGLHRFSPCPFGSRATQVKGIIAEQLGVELDSVVPGASFTEDLGADSLDAVELIMAIEEAFDIEIPDEEAETMTTPADCVTAIKAKI